MIMNDTDAFILAGGASRRVDGKHASLDTDSRQEPVSEKRYVWGIQAYRCQKQTRADDAPFARRGFHIQEVVCKARHVRAMESADPEMNDARCDRRRFVRRPHDVARQFTQRRARQANRLHRKVTHAGDLIRICE